MIYDTTYDPRFEAGFSPLENPFTLWLNDSLAEELAACGEYAMTRSIARIGSKRLARRAQAEMDSDKNQPGVDMETEAVDSPSRVPFPFSHPASSFHPGPLQKIATLMACLLSLDLMSFLCPSADFLVPRG